MSWSFVVLTGAGGSGKAKARASAGTAADVDGADELVLLRLLIDARPALPTAVVLPGTFCVLVCLHLEDIHQYDGPDEPPHDLSSHASENSHPENYPDANLAPCKLYETPRNIG